MTPNNPTALITGASAGIGEAIARDLAARGYSLILAARSKDLLDQLAAELAAKHNIRATVEVCDLTDPAAPAALAAKLSSTPIDLLVNNAGFGLNQRFWQADLRRQLDMIQLNISALTELTHRLLPAMIERRQGRVLNVASIAGFLPGPYQAVYFATKAFVLSFSTALNEELRAAGHKNITITALCPGPVKTKFGATAGFHNPSLFKGPAVLTPAAVAKIGINAALGGKPIAVAGLVNKIMTLSTRLIPRTTAARIAMKLQVPANQPAPTPPAR